ncbi:MAG TPA: hypothetical protein VKN63_10285 [Afifellaceae bacterium]|nr:hypothetical protein [Afifellaceae bacterium]
MFSRLAVIAVILVGSAFLLGYGPNLAASKTDIPRIENMESVGNTGPLDGMEFVSKLGPEGKPKDVDDRFVFSDGTFVSKECELRCSYPARAYYIKETNTGTEFVSNTKCPHKDAEITWHGTVKGTQISGTAIWTIKRWYWTVTNTFEFEGQLNEKPSISAVGS